MDLPELIPHGEPHTVPEREKKDSGSKAVHKGTSGTQV